MKQKSLEDVKIIVLTMYDDQETVTKTMEMGNNDVVSNTVIDKCNIKHTVRQFYPKPV